MSSQPKVLIVDDDASIRAEIEAILADENYELHFAENGARALQIASEIEPNIILLDVMMPGDNGFEVCAKIRAMALLAETPIVLVTSLDDRDARLTGIKAGADDFLTKPIDGDKLRLRVHNLTRMSRYQQQNLYNSIELKYYESFLSGQNNDGDQSIIQMNVIANICDYVEADAAELLMFDIENPELVSRKLLGDGPAWLEERAFFTRDKWLPTHMQEIMMIEGGSSLMEELEPVFADVLQTPLQHVLLAPMHVNGQLLGAMLFSNPKFDLKKDDRRTRFLQLMVKAVANATFALEHIRQLTISKAALEASQWEIINSRNMLRTFFDNVPSCIYVVDRSYTIQIINKRRSERAGKKPQQLVGGKCYEQLFGYTAPCPHCRVGDAFQGIPALRNMREWQEKETFVQWEISTFPIRESNGLVNRAIVLDEDVTEKWILESNLIESEKLASIGQLAANVAHEINNPLAAIIANAQLLMRDLRDANEDTVESLQLIEIAGTRAARIVGDLLKSARKEKRDEFEQISLNQTIQEALSMASFEIRNRNITVRLDLDESMPMIFAHQNQLKGVWINLIMNAVGAIETEKGSISISTHYEDHEYRVSFSDNGKGIAPEHQEHIFEPFFTTKEVGRGTGLGLSVSQQVIKEHHGTIDFESAPGMGTKFIIILPELQPNEE